MYRDLLLVTISLLTWGLGEGLFIYFQPLYLQQLGADPIAIGAILGGMGITMTVVHVPAGIIADRWGRRPIMWLSWIVGTFAIWMMALANSLFPFVVGILIYGLTTFVSAPMNSYIAGARRNLSVGRALTLVSGMYYLGAIAGPWLGGVIGQSMGIKSIYMFSGGIVLVSTLIILFIRPQPVDPPSQNKESLILIGNHRFTGLLVIVFVVLFALYLPQPLTPNFLQNQRNLSLASIGQLGSLGNLGNAFLMLTLGNLSGSLGFLLGQVSIGLFAFLLWRGAGFAWYGLGYFFIGGYRLCRMMILTLVRPLVHPSQVGLAFGSFVTVNGLAVVLAPILAGYLYQMNPGWMYPVSLVLIAVTLIVSRIYLVAHQPVPVGSP
jgi:DHA1 family multidrug resistance protein-like MFS transporter